MLLLPVKIISAPLVQNYNSQSIINLLIEKSLQNAPDSAIADAEVSLQNVSRNHLNFNKYIPAIDIYGNQWYVRQQEQLRPNFRTGLGSGEQFTNNNGVVKNIGVQLTFDLQKMFGPESAIAGEHAYYSEIQKKLARRNIIKVVKNYYISLYFLQQSKNNLIELEKYLNSLKTLTHGMKASGIFVGVEENIIRTEFGYLQNELINNKHQEEILISGLAMLTKLSMDEIKQMVFSINTSDITEVFPVKTVNLSLESFLKSSDHEILFSLGRDYNILKSEYDNYSRIPLPIVFVRRFNQYNTVQTSWGSNHSAEFGFIFPVTGFLHKDSHKSELEEKMNGAHELLKKNILAYRSSIRISASHLLDLKAENMRLEKDRTDSGIFLKKGISLFRQKRLDMAGVIDSVKKYMEISRLLFYQKETIYKLETELEYLTGGFKIE